MSSACFIPGSGVRCVSPKYAAFRRRCCTGCCTSRRCTRPSREKMPRSRVVYASGFPPVSCVPHTHASLSLPRFGGSRSFCVAPDIAQAKRIQRVRHERLQQTPGLVMCTNIGVLLKEHGPPAPSWLLFTAGRAQGVVPGSVQRFGWSTLISQANAM